MKLRKVTINNYLSLKDVTLTFGDMTILVGKNGSGKTNILEALYRFFADFNAIGGTSSGLTEYYWFNKDTTNPIRISVELELDEEDFKKIFYFLPDALRDFLKALYDEKALLLSISRQIIPHQYIWRTEYLKWGDIYLVKNDSPINLDELLRSLIPEMVTEDFVLHLFTPHEMVGDRLLVDTSKKVAYFPNKQIDRLATIGIIKISKDTIGQNYRNWCTQQGIKLIERPPTGEEVPFLLSLEPEYLVSNLLASIANNIRGKFRFIPATRDEKYVAGMRNPIVDSSLLSTQSKLSVSMIREDELKWSTFRNWVERFLERRVEPNPTELLVTENGLRVPVRFLGGGEQEVFALMWHFLDKGFIYGIEEPENHFHPEYLKKLFKFFKEISKERQIILTTHTPLLVDKTNIENNWLVKREKGETKVQQLKDREELKLVLLELGLVPSDIYFKDFVLFVEGDTEKEVIPILAEKLGFEDIIDRIFINPIGGEGKLEYHFRIWLGILNILPIEYLVLLDKHSEMHVVEVIKKLNLDSSRFYIFEKGSIEDYYPVELVMKALKDLFGIEIKEEKINLGIPMDKTIEHILDKYSKKRRGWKVDIGKYVASQMAEEQIPKEVKEILGRIKKQISS
jgi:predicted ATP-dependent endonuclease of OLD family